MKFRILLIFIIASLNVACHHTGYEKEFQTLELGTDVHKIHKQFDEPDLSHKPYDGKFVEVYKYAFNEYVFIYSEKDSTLVKKWKEY